MKIRERHVSNSSSSSFLLIVTQDAFKKSLKGATPLVKDIVKWLEPEKSKVLGKDVFVISTYDSYGEGTFFNLVQSGEVKIDIPPKESDPEGEQKEGENEDYIRRDIVDNAWNEFVSELKKDKDNVFTRYEND